MKRDEHGELIMYYDRQGRALTMHEWAAMIESRNDEAKRVAETTVGEYWISTVWLGIDHSFGNGPPLIFETMIFALAGRMNDLFQDQYSTEDEAVHGHAQVADAVRRGLLPVDCDDTVGPDANVVRFGK